jgi:hypothetical protein
MGIIQSGTGVHNSKMTLMAKTVDLKNKLVVSAGGFRVDTRGDKTAIVVK